ncbi:MAG: DUF4440 domain-containing protein [Candidatus Marinimicrobia bacterium]|jgi:RimJ/RimL family protein N-acetyltransferase|nr:DUF4440 domain-containing protein [Candidatus Neomarinimicrobiota bacterium]
MIAEKKILEIAHELKRAFEEKDLKAIENIYSDDIVVWHNYDRIERNRNQSLESAKWVISEIENFSIDECSIFPIEGGFIQQCVFHGIYKSTGKRMETHAMIHVYCQESKVNRIEDYSDPNQGSVPDIE